MPSTVTDRLNGVTTSVAVKAPCQAVALSNITLSGLQTISGHTTAEGDRVLVKAQTNGVDNGIYVASTGMWSRAKDANSNRDLVQGTRVLVRSATVDGVEYELTTANPVVIGTSELTFVLRYGANATIDQTEAEIAAAVTPNNVGYPPGDLRRYGGIGDGATNSTTALTNAAAQAAQSGGSVVLVSGGTFKISSNTTLASTVSLDFSEGGLLSIDSGITLSHNGAVFANPGRRIFTGSGTVQFGTTPNGTSRSAVAEVYPEWWGARADASTDCTSAINSAIASLRWGGTVRFTGGVYMLDPVELSPSVQLRGAGKDQTLLKVRTAATTSPFLLLDNSGGSGILVSSGFCIADLTLDGAGNATTGCHGIQVNNYGIFTIQDCNIQSFDKCVYLHGAISCSLYRCRLYNSQFGFDADTDYSTINAVSLRDCYIQGCETWGVRITEGAVFSIIGGTIEGCGTAGNPNTGGLQLNDMDRDGLGVAATILSVWFEQCHGHAAIQITAPHVNYSTYTIRNCQVVDGTRTYGLVAAVATRYPILDIAHCSFKHAGTTDLHIGSFGLGIVSNCVATASSVSTTMTVLNHPANGHNNFPYLSIADGVTAPAAQSGFMHFYVDTADGDLKVKFSDGTVKTVTTDT